MTIYQIIGVNNEFMSFRSLEKPIFLEDGSFANQGRNIFSTDGYTKKVEWILPPKVLLQSEPTNQKKYKGKKRKVPDVGHVAIGSLVFSQKAVESIGDYLKTFGELLPIDAEGTRYYFYNVTTIVDVIDPHQSIFSPKGAVVDEVFDINKAPKTAQIFKVKGMESSSVYFNKVDGKPSFVDVLTKAGLHGGTVMPMPMSVAN